MKKIKISMVSKGLLLVVMLLFIGSLFVPMWRIELAAPQYPEGLVLQLYANKIGGDVEIINGLNHYIGMATLHTENFFEFKILSYCCWFCFTFIAFNFHCKKKSCSNIFYFLHAFCCFSGYRFLQMELRIWS